MVKRVRLYPVTLADRRAMQEIARLSFFIFIAIYDFYRGKSGVPSLLIFAQFLSCKSEMKFIIPCDTGISNMPIVLKAAPLGSVSPIGRKRQIECT